MQTSNRLGCLSGTGILAAVITSLLIGGYVYAKGGLLYNPGPLNAQPGEMLGGVTSHAETNGKCRACHTAPWERATMADRCAICHSAIASQMQDVASLHGRMMHNAADLTCRHCHPEHRGADAALTQMEGGSFPHEVVGFYLNGHRVGSANKAFTCDDCHNGDITTFAPDTCSTCHSQLDSVFALAHSLEYGMDCLACHDGVDRFGRKFKHDFRFNLTGAHEGLLCSKCHTGARTFSDFQNISTNCQSCHLKDDAHQGTFGTDCGACHTPQGWEPATFDHNLAAFKLEGKHAGVKCDQCHVNNIFKGTPSDCFSCHQQDDHHDGRFGSDCAACHRSTNWDDVTFDHNKSNFPLTGRHAAVACEQCHSSGQFQSLSTSCASCHADPVFHAGLFGIDCAACHGTANWFARYTGPHPSFGEHGGINHEGATCRDCHTKTLREATCLKCHDSNNPEGGEGGGEHEGGG